MSFVDAHAHLSADPSIDISGILQRALGANVASIINVCSSREDLKRGLQLAKTCHAPKIYTVAALTPHDAAKNDETFFAEVAACLSNKELVAVGEIGLDYHYNYAPKEVQKSCFERYLKLACSAKLPVVIHCRDAFDDLCQILDKRTWPIDVMLHCFTGTLDEAKRAVDRGWYISLSGIVTFPKSVALQEVAKFVPTDRLLIETDTPYLAPQGFRGQKNEPALLVETAKIVATLRDTSVTELAEITTINVQRLFHVLS